MIEAGFNSNFGKRKKATYIYLTATLDADIFEAALATLRDISSLALRQSKTKKEAEINLKIQIT